jgi:hypothetical protein
METLMRKTNRTKLLDVKKEWEREYGKKRKVDTPPTPAADDHHSSNTSAGPLEFIIQKILQPESSQIDKVIAATLHESSQNELPCWDDDDDNSDLRYPYAVQVCFFLGAVRDMHKIENRALRRVCDGIAVPLLRIRLGPVAEFTSKILTVLAYHDANNRLLPACLRLLLRSQEKTSSSSLVCTDTNSHSHSPATFTGLVLHFICEVPASSGDVSTRLDDRKHWIWCMVRCIVTSLWRSRLASGKGNSNAPDQTSDTTVLQNRLSFLFQDGVTLTLDQWDLVTEMAEQHQAAPSEYQILFAVRQKLDGLMQAEPSKSLYPKSASELLHDLFFDRVVRKVHHPSIWIDFSGKSTPSENDFYKAIPNGINAANTLTRLTTETSKLIAIAIPFSRNGDIHAVTASTNSSILLDIQKCCRDKSTSKWSIVGGQKLVDVDCIDQEAVTITMLQHLAYQERLLPLCKYFDEKSTSP